MARNLAHIQNARTLSLIIGGVTAGIFGFDGAYGMAFYVFLVFLTSLFIGLCLGFQGKPYFSSLTQAITSGLFTNMLTYLLMWVMFYNLVYVL